MLAKRGGDTKDDIYKTGMERYVNADICGIKERHKTEWKLMNREYDEAPWRLRKGQWTHTNILVKVCTNR